MILNYRTPALVLDCLASLVDQLEADRDLAVVVDNASGDGSSELLEREIAGRGWSDRVRLAQSPRNGGFSAGNNLGLAAVRARWYLLLNSDTIVRPGAVAELLRAGETHARAGIVSPRLEWPDGTVQVSCFRNRSPLSEFLSAASTRPITRLLPGFEVPLPVADAPFEPEWTSFAAAMLRVELIEQIGPLDEGYFMYFEDIEYCRRARRAGWTVLHWPAARVVHLRGGSSQVKSSAARRRRLPRYYYAARARYFATFYSTPGLWLANLLWWTGRSIARVRELFGRRAPKACEREWIDNWTNWLRPIQPRSDGEKMHGAAA